MIQNKRRDSLPLSINVLYPEFIDNIEKIIADKNIRDRVASEGRGYGVNRSTVVQWLVAREARRIDHPSDGT